MHPAIPTSAPTPPPSGVADTNEEEEGGSDNAGVRMDAGGTAAETNCVGMQFTTILCNALQRPATPCNAMQRPVTPCNAL